ncbi:hypothetical protein H8356DRAFT_1745817 [Neocallimastix lanati (nom. inval.)]|jgi:hypothetical protein|uniref:Uncharacterized protein n=1 Tax=Neocallimastix californiae TaxID=1754190 RepID=A0A1Y2C701_9FUNG|nr:hypothetical protein H8356DRAFT_1745817 [Neocallimastix sp. JGI-2020a]ORY42674.1 hypothetical protein LY90DRAFT_703822 [Neocallimastix californiae]|eukprot:ORY42674.1 hypothetical protein LY90DRAFT_703822 [Neocallimastix californiae]
MKYSKFILVLCLFITLTTAVPVPLFENIFGSKEEGTGIFSIFKSKDKKDDSDSSVPPPDSTPANAPVNAQVAASEDSFDINSIPKDADIPSLVTNGVSQLIQTNLCSSLGSDEANSLCQNISSGVLNAASNALTGVIRSSINSASGNGVSIACSLIPNEIFKKLTSGIVNAITTQIANSGNADAENIGNITNTILTVIINTVENLLCSGGSSNGDGNVIINDISNLINNITHKANYINNDVAASLRNGSQLSTGTNADIATGIADIQDAIKMQYKAQYKPAYDYKNY